MTSLPRVAISAGDPSGISFEVVRSALRHRAVRRALTPVVFGDASLAPALPDTVLHVVSQLPARDRRPGKPTRAGGLAQYAYLTAAIDAVKRGVADAICTAPVSKEQISRAGIPFMGHTEVLAEAFDRQVLMLMDGPRAKVALATNHLALRDVPRALTVKGLTSQLVLLSKTMEPVLGRAPHIGVCGLNPHAGEGGLLGTEEVRVIVPAIRAAIARGVRCSGPYPADGLFAKASRGLPCDVVLAMFHDQGLVATKTLDFAKTVNVTLGLPVVRTSPDHGVAYDVAGLGRADAEPMVEALVKAATYARQWRSV